MKTRRTMAASSLAVLLVSVGCDDSSVRESLGVLQRGPDPFAVMPHRPIEFPEGDELPAPSSDLVSRTSPDPISEATRVFGANPGGALEASDTELALLALLGASAPDPDIRAVVRADREEQKEAQDGRPVLHHWFGAVDRDYRREHVLDPLTELERLREAGILSQPIAEGETRPGGEE